MRMLGEQTIHGEMETFPSFDDRTCPAAENLAQVRLPEGMYRTSMTLKFCSGFCSAFSSRGYWWEPSGVSPLSLPSHLSKRSLQS